MRCSPCLCSGCCWCASSAGRFFVVFLLSRADLREYAEHKVCDQVDLLAPLLSSAPGCVVAQPNARDAVERCFLGYAARLAALAFVTKLPLQRLLS